jgi:hypothetical protein
LVEIIILNKKPLFAFIIREEQRAPEAFSWQTSGEYLGTVCRPGRPVVKIKGTPKI